MQSQRQIRALAIAWMAVALLYETYNVVVCSGSGFANTIAWLLGFSLVCFVPALVCLRWFSPIQSIFSLLFLFPLHVFVASFASCAGQPTEAGMIYVLGLYVAPVVALAGALVGRLALKKSSSEDK